MEGEEALSRQHSWEHSLRPLDPEQCDRIEDLAHLDSDGTIREECERFYCGARLIPKNIIHYVMKKMGTNEDFRNEDKFFPDKICDRMVELQLLNRDERYTIKIPSTIPRQKIEAALGALYRKGNQPRVLVLFHKCLMETSRVEGMQSHLQLATDMQLHALMQCRMNPVWGDIGITGVSSMDILKRAVRHLSGIRVSEETITELLTFLDLSGQEIQEHETDLGEVCSRWLSVKESCTPEKLVKALLFTPSLGRYASGLYYPVNPVGVQEYLVDLGDSWKAIPIFMGFNGEEFMHHKIHKHRVKKFLDKFRLPSCRNDTVSVVRELAHYAARSSEMDNQKASKPLKGKSMHQSSEEDLEVDSPAPAGPVRAGYVSKDWHKQSAMEEVAVKHKPQLQARNGTMNPSELVENKTDAMRENTLRQIPSVLQPRPGNVSREFSPELSDHQEVH